VESLRARHRDELEEFNSAAEQSGERNAQQRKALEDRHHREDRRWRTDQLRDGLAVMAGAYRDRMLAATQTNASDGGRTRSHDRIHELADAIAALERAGAELVRNPNETLLLEALLVRLSAVTGG
jgi:DNA polymerase-3 subunit delta'